MKKQFIEEAALDNFLDIAKFYLSMYLSYYNIGDKAYQGVGIFFNDVIPFVFYRSPSGTSYFVTASRYSFGSPSMISSA